MPFVKTADDVTTAGSILLLPAVSIGNVPQLAIDLFVNTLQLPRIGILDTPHLTPLSGPAGFDHQTNTRSVPLEVYQTPDKHWTIVQQRSPPLPHHHRAFAQELIEFIQQAGFAKVMLLASSDAALRNDKLIDGPQIRTISVGEDELTARFRALSVTDLHNAPSGEDGCGALKGALAHLHSAGVTKHLARLCLDAGVPLTACVSLVNEGDNVPDAVMMANAVNSALELMTDRTAQWRPPRSWEWLMPSNTPAEMF
ncbi:hypothetical protein FBU59_006391 [Linderina macrospora]|uniref:Uncharacterized protein n=1 Tax=Linderina macrospora TaxID=4868 RepID=A0ACC1J003_9FUNG|nr:hypothetical protein FBU59_006391 [Linderina macrospora]